MTSDSPFLALGACAPGSGISALLLATG